MTAAFPLALFLIFQAAPEPSPEIVREIVVAGASVYEGADVTRILRQAEGQPLRAAPEALAARLESRYHIDGYLAASVTASFEGGRLLFTVDEGRLAEVRVEGVQGASARRAVGAADLVPGRVLEQAQVWDALARIEKRVRRRAQARRRSALHGGADTRGGAPRAARAPDPGEDDGPARGPAGRRAVQPRRRALPRPPGRAHRPRHRDLRSPAPLDARLLGFSSDKLRYALGAARSLFGKKLVLGYEYHDLTDTDDTWHKRGLEEGTGGIINTQSTSDYFRRVGHLAFAFAHAAPGLELGAMFHFDYYTSLPVTTDDSLIGYSEPRVNLPVEEGRMRSLVLAAGWASRGALFPTETAKRRSFVQRNLYQLGVTKPEGVRVEATLEVASPDFGSDYDFTRLIGNVRTHHELGPRFVLDTRLVAGSTTGDPPSFKRFYLGGVGTLRGYEPKQFDGTEMALFTVETAFIPGAGGSRRSSPSTKAGRPGARP